MHLHDKQEMSVNIGTKDNRNLLKVLTLRPYCFSGNRSIVSPDHQMIRTLVRLIPFFFCFFFLSGAYCHLGILNTAPPREGSARHSSDFSPMFFFNYPKVKKVASNVRTLFRHPREPHRIPCACFFIFPLVNNARDMWGMQH